MGVTEYRGRYGKCPICQTEGWCFFTTNDHNHVVTYCRRVANGDKMAGSSVDDCHVVNGNGTFHFIGMSKGDGVSRFLQEDDWLEEHVEYVQNSREEWATRQGLYYDRERNQYRDKKGHWHDAKPIEGFNRSQPRLQKPAAASAPAEPKEDLLHLFPKGTDAAHLDAVYRKMLSCLVLEEPDLFSLQKKDGWSEELLHKILKYYPIRTLPPYDRDRGNACYRGLKNPTRILVCKKILAEGLDLRGVYGFYSDPEKGPGIAPLPGYMIPVMNPNGQIIRFNTRLSQEARESMARNDYSKKKATLLEEAASAGIGESGREEWAFQQCLKKQGKYHNFASNNRPYGTESGDQQLGFVGHDLLDNPMALSRVLIMEGAKKGLVAWALTGQPCIVMPGVSSYNLLDKEWEGMGMTPFEWLRKMGVRTIAVANDADMATNMNVFHATETLLKKIHGAGFNAQMVQWGSAYGKGIDDCLLHGGRLRYTNIACETE